MATFKTLLSIGVLGLTPLLADFPIDVSGQILYHAHRGQADLALTRYLECVNLTSKHDYALLQQIGLAILEEGSRSGDPEIELMCLLGAGVSSSPRLLPILEAGIQSSDQRTQLVALNFLSRLGDDTTDELLLKALNSPFLLTRLEALFQLSIKRHPAVLEHLQSLFVKIPDPIRPLFCQIVINLDSTSANQMMRQLLSDHDLNTRCQAISAVAAKKRDDFLPQLRTLGTQTQIAQQECVASTLGLLKDRSSTKLLKQMVNSRQPNVKLAAAFALYQLGDKDYLPLIFDAAQQHDLFAIALLSEAPLDESRELLTTLTHAQDKDVQLGAALALLQMRDANCLPVIRDVLLSGKEALGYVISHSPGRIIPVWRTVLSAPFKENTYPGIMTQTNAFRSQILVSCVELPESCFLDLAHLIFAQEVKPLIPVLAELLINHRSPATIALLKQQCKSNPSDFIRATSLLALYRMGEDGPYEQALVDWVKKRHNTVLIRFSESPPSDRPSSQILTAEEESALLIEAFETLAQAQNEAGIEALLNAIAHGNVKNRYALAGLLIRTAE